MLKVRKYGYVWRMNIQILLLNAVKTIEFSPEYSKLLYMSCTYFNTSGDSYSIYTMNNCMHGTRTVHYYIIQSWFCIMSLFECHKAEDIKSLDDVKYVLFCSSLCHINMKTKVKRTTSFQPSFIHSITSNAHSFLAK